MITVADEHLWHRYACIWENVFLNVLGRREDEFATFLRRKRSHFECSADKQEGFGFFYDPPWRHMFVELVGEPLCDQLGSTLSMPEVVLRLWDAIMDGADDRTVDWNTFDWVAARDRYSREKNRIEQEVTA